MTIEIATTASFGGIDLSRQPRPLLISRGIVTRHDFVLCANVEALLIRARYARDMGDGHHGLWRRAENVG